MPYKRIRLVVGISLIAIYFIVFWTPIAGYLPCRRIIAEGICLLADSVIWLFLHFFSNRIAKKRGDELPYPDFPWAY